MTWLWLVAGVLLLVFVAAMSRRAKHRATVRGFQQEFPRIARQRLVGNFPELDPVLDQITLRMLFNWMLAQAYCRTNTAGFGELMQWQKARGDEAMAEMLGDLTIAAVERLPRPALQVIDSASGGRAYAAILIEHSLAEAGARISPPLEREDA